MQYKTYQSRTLLLLKPHVHLPLRFVHFWLRLILLSFQFKRCTIFVDVAQSKNMIPIMSELCYATISRKRPTGLDILGGCLRDVLDWVFLRKLPEICGAIVAHPWRGRSRRLFHAGVESKSNTETRTITTPSLRQTLLKKDRQIPHWSHLINVGLYYYKETEERTLGKARYTY